MFKVGTMLKAREVRLSRKKPPYHSAMIPGTSFLSDAVFKKPRQKVVRISKFEHIKGAANV
jgi:hypothetical protein